MHSHWFNVSISAEPFLDKRFPCFCITKQQRYLGRTFPLDSLVRMSKPYINIGVKQRNLFNSTAIGVLDSVIIDRTAQRPTCPRCWFYIACCQQNIPTPHSRSNLHLYTELVRGLLDYNNQGPRPYLIITNLIFQQTALGISLEVIIWALQQLIRVLVSWGD